MPKDAEIGKYVGTMYVSGEDEWGNPTEFDLLVVLAIEAKVVGTETDVKSTVLRVTNDNWLTYALAGLSGMLLVVFVVQSIIMRGKVRKVEEGRL